VVVEVMKGLALLT